MAALVSAAQRRQQRRLRSWWRHEQQSIAAVLATVSHHSYSKVDTANGALRGQKLGTSTSFLSSFRTMAGPQGRSGQRHCLSRGRRRRCSVTQASGTNSPRISMFLCCTWWNSCPTSSSSSPRVCRWLPSRLSTCPRSHWTGLSSAWGTVCVNRRRRTSWWKCPRI